MNAATHHISPNFTAEKASPGTFEDWVEIWEDRMRGWLLAPATKLRESGPHCHIAALQIAVAFFEPYEMFLEGRNSQGHSREFFCRAFRSVFSKTEPPLTDSVLKEVAAEFYQQVRCGLFHSAMPRNKVFITNTIQTIAVDVDPNTERVHQIRINPSSVIDAVEVELNRYVAILKDPTHADHGRLRQAFEDAWHLYHSA